VVAGFGALDIRQVNLLLMLAALMGDSTGYLLGRQTGPKIFSRPDSRFFKQAYVTRTHQFYERYGGKTMCWRVSCRSSAPFPPSWPESARCRICDSAFSVCGGIGWVFLMTSLGYLLGQVAFVQRNFDKVILVIILLSLTPTSSKRGERGGGRKARPLPMVAAPLCQGCVRRVLRTGSALNRLKPPQAGSGSSRPVRICASPKLVRGDTLRSGRRRSVRTRSPRDRGPRLDRRRRSGIPAVAAPAAAEDRGPPSAATKEERPGSLVASGEQQKASWAPTAHVMVVEERERRVKVAGGAVGEAGQPLDRHDDLGRLPKRVDVAAAPADPAVDAVRSKYRRRVPLRTALRPA